MKQRNFEDTLNRLDEYLTPLDDDAFFAKLGTSLEELKCKSKGAKKMIDPKKLLDLLENLDATYIKVDVGERCVIAGTAEFSKWVDENCDAETGREDREKKGNT